MSKMICPKAKECGDKCFVGHNKPHKPMVTCDRCCVHVKDNLNTKCIPYCATTRPNPSPRDIFQHIKTDCERRAFDEFMRDYLLSWSNPLTDGQLVNIRDYHKYWYSWLQSKGLVEKKKLKKQAWVNVYYNKLSGVSTGVIRDTREKALSDEKTKSSEYLHTIFLHEWEE